MENETKKYPVAEKQGFIVGAPFRVISEARDVWITNYAYHLKQKRTNGSLKPLMGRKTKDGKFEVYIDGSWQEKDLWKEYSEDAMDESGAPIMIKGRPKKNLLFDNRKEILMEFSTPVSLTYWDSDLKQKVTQDHTIAYARVSKSVAEKITEQINTMAKLGVNNPFFVMKYDGKKAPAEQYKVEFSHKGE